MNEINDKNNCRQPFFFPQAVCDLQIHSNNNYWITTIKVIIIILLLGIS